MRITGCTQRLPEKKIKTKEKKPDFIEELSPNMMGLKKTHQQKEKESEKAWNHIDRSNIGFEGARSDCTSTAVAHDSSDGSRAPCTWLLMAFGLNSSDSKNSCIREWNKLGSQVYWKKQHVEACESMLEILMQQHLGGWPVVEVRSHWFGWSELTYQRTI